MAAPSPLSEARKEDSKANLGRFHYIHAMAPKPKPPPPPAPRWATAAADTDTDIDTIHDIDPEPPYPCRKSNTKCPSKSSIELDVFGLSYSGHDAAAELEAAIAAINTRADTVYAPGQAGYIETKFLTVLRGEPQTYCANESTARVRFSPGKWDQPVDTLVKDMNAVRRALVEKGYEAYWSCARVADKRNWGTFTFTPGEDETDELTETEARLFCAKLCMDRGHETVDVFLPFKFQASRRRQKPLMVTVKFHHAASVHLFEAAIAGEALAKGHYTVTYSPCTGVIFPDSPATIALPNVSSHSLKLMEWQLVQRIDEFNATRGLKEGIVVRGRLVHAKHYVVTVSSMRLASHLCHPEWAYQDSNEFVYDLNEHNLARRDAVQNRIREQQERQRLNDLEELDTLRSETYRGLKGVEDLRKLLATERQQIDRLVLRFDEDHKRYTTTFLAFMEMLQKWLAHHNRMAGIFHQTLLRRSETGSLENQQRLIHDRISNLDIRLAAQAANPISVEHLHESRGDLVAQREDLYQQLQERESGDALLEAQRDQYLADFNRDCDFGTLVSELRAATFEPVEEDVRASKRPRLSSSPK
ncbi:uncharacterized protein EHS24_002485 [Apiotrichum porosum]|uniref:Uncharacterized protein n=1 Tax=Apiotrichum porosum TaxID=105984 RepID=A0A427XGS4_9TREE|nr:uncharacterized protein EHS24_002485 [Apiotrichum porosum]RSH78032.1 hypothetical protein EHS24_002485 [Apiotrichum porosum]